MKKYLAIFSILFTVFGLREMNAQCLQNQHSSISNDAWTSCQTSPNPNSARGNSFWLMYDFGSTYFLADTHIWNANEQNALDKGMRDVIIDYSLDGINWTQLGAYQFSQGTGISTYSGFTGPDFGGLQARYIIITALTTWGNSCASLAEVQFNLTSQIRTEIQLTAFLEGAYNPSTNSMNTGLTNYIPLNQVYNIAPYNYTGSESLTSTLADMVDWVLVEVRQGTPNTTGTRNTQTIETKAAILKSDGQIVDATGGPLTFDLAQGSEYYFCLRHRNHLDVLTAVPLTANAPILTYDFTTNTNQAFGGAQLKTMSDGKAALYAGDFNQDGTIQTTDFDAWAIKPAVLYTYDYIDGNLDGTVQVTDYDTWYLNRSKLGIVELGY